MLLAHALGVTQETVLRDRHLPVDAPAYDALIARRAAHEPLALILGRREFWSLDFLVSADTLIPRGDSETLIDAALAAFPDRAAMQSMPAPQRMEAMLERMKQNQTRMESHAIIRQN